MMGLHLCLKLTKLSLYILHYLFKLLWPLELSFGHDLLMTIRLLKEITVVECTLIDLIDFIISKPLNALAILPQPCFRTSVFRIIIQSNTMLLSSIPISFILSSIDPGVNAKSVLLIIFVLSLILPSITPLVCSISIHIILIPQAFILPAINPLVDS